MLPKHIKEQIVWLFNDPEIWNSMKVLINHRIDKIRQDNDTVVGHDEFSKNQGSIRELKALLNIQEHIKAEHAKGK